MISRCVCESVLRWDEHLKWYMSEVGCQPQCGWAHHPPFEDLNRTKRQRRGEYGFAWPLEHKHQPSAFRLGFTPSVLRPPYLDLILHYQFSWLLVLLTWTGTTPPTCLGLQLADGRCWDFLPSIIYYINNINIFYRIYISPIGSVFLKNPNTKVTYLNINT